MSLLVKDGNGANVTLKTTTDAGEEVQHQRIDGVVAVEGAEVDGATATGKAVMIAGVTAGGNAQFIEVNASGHVNIADGGGSITVDGPLTDAQLRATSVPVSTGLSQPLTDAQLRASAVPVSLASQPLPTGAATETTLAAINTKVATEAKQDNIITAINNLLASVYDEDSPHTSGAKGQLMLAIRSDSDTPTANDGDYTILKLDEAGRLKVSTMPASYPDVTGDITAVQATIGTPVAGGTVIANVARASNVMMFCTGTFSAVNCTFEGSLEDTGENWFGLQSVRSNANTIENTTGSLSAAPAYSWELSVNALARVRVRCTARTSGTQSWRIKLGTYATEPIPAAQVSATQPVSGTVTANIGTGSIAAGTNAIGDVGIQYRGNATGAGIITNINCPATPAVQTIKGSAGRLLGFYLVNTNATIRYFKVFNILSPTLASSAASLRVPLPQNQPVFVAYSGGMGLGTAITCAVCSTSSLTDATGPVTLDDVTGFSVHA